MTLKNKTKTDCGVVAVANAVAWCNLGKTYEEVEKVARACGYGQRGIYGFQFVNLLRKLKIPAKRVGPLGLEYLENQLHNGKMFIFFYTPYSVRPGASGHVVTAFADHTGNIRIVNPDRHRRTWRSFVSDLNENGVKNFASWEVPERPRA